VTITLLYLLLKVFCHKALTLSDVFVCGFFFPKTFTQGMCWWRVCLWVFLSCNVYHGVCYTNRTNLNKYYNTIPHKHQNDETSSLFPCTFIHCSTNEGNNDQNNYPKDCPERFWGIIGRDPNVFKFKWLHADIFHFFRFYFKVYSIDSSTVMGYFLEVLKLNRFICNLCPFPTWLYQITKVIP
jgi:hypothetical protein